jgi:ATP-dependent DNA helicase RecG
MASDLGSVAVLEGWMREKEGEQFEFKEAKRDFDFERLCKYAAAIANEGGGRIILGVTDARPRRVVGSMAFGQPERTRQGLRERMPLPFDFEEIHHPDCSPGSRVLVFQIPPRPIGVPIKFDGRYWMRDGDQLGEMSEERLRGIFAESGRDFSAGLCPGLTTAQLDPEAVEGFRSRWIAKARKADDLVLAERLKSLSHEELLADAEALIDGGLNYAALILFGTRQALGRHLAQAEVVFEYRSSDQSGPAQDRREYRQGFFSYYDDLWNLINLRNDKQDFQDGLFVHPISTFNERPVREAILNAVSHRNYELGGSIFIRQFARRLEVDSPGGFPFGINVDNILDRQNPRNRRIAEILTRCGLVERSGQGMNLIYEDLIKHGKPVPDFARTDAHQVGLTLHGTVQDPAFVRFVEKVCRETSVSLGTHDWVFLAAVARGERFPRHLDGRTPRLLDLGIIERLAGRSYMLSRRYYELTDQTAAYTRRKGLDRKHNLALLLQHIESRRETGCKLEELCEVIPSLPVTRVQSLLRTLKRMGAAHPVGKRRAGFWVPGPGESEDGS